MPKTAPYGSWKSPITADLIVSEVIGVGSPRIDGDAIYWLESRPAEAGRQVVVRRSPDGTTADVNPAPFNARTRVHEYGGGSYLPFKGTAYFSNFADDRLYRVAPGEEPQPITPEGPWRYADFITDAKRGRLISVREDHSDPEHEAVNTLVAVPFDGGEQKVLASGNDFYSSPRLNPDGRTLAYLSWCHPNMPWDGTELWLADIAEDGSLADQTMVAGGPAESIFQPEWAPDGSLVFISDRTGWWNPYRWDGARVRPIVQMEAEFGTTQWAFGISTYGFISADELLCAVVRNGIGGLYRLNTSRGELRPVDTQFTEPGSIQVGPGFTVFVAGSPSLLPSIIRLNLGDDSTQILKRASEIQVDPCYLSVPKPISFPTEGGLTAHAIYYPPHNCEYGAPENDKPPLIVRSHGGPTGRTSSTLELDYQFWTSRGFALVDVNYGGSTGYGREYRERLECRWGVVDVDDCVNAARYLVDQGLADPNRLIIVGGSAGGYTTLAALTFRDVFKAGASHFGIGDLVPFVDDTHKFESRYVDRLVAPYAGNEELYRERSPIYHTDRLNCPVILFQGLEDKVVPPNQAQLMADALQKKGVPYAYVAFEGEGHGFRKAENIKAALEGELYFYSRIFGFDLPDAVTTVPIKNLGDRQPTAPA